MKSITIPRVALIAATMIVLTVTSGCAHGLPFRQVSANLPILREDNGRIFFYRTTAFGAAVQPQVWLNDEVVGTAVPKGFFYVDRPAGDYVARCTTEVKRALSFTLKAGETRYVHLKIVMGAFVGHVVPELVEPVVAEARMQKTNLVHSHSLTPAGTGGSYEIRAYSSPMTVNTEFVISDRTLWGRKVWRTSPAYIELAGHVCERVAITSLEMNAEDAGKGTVRVAIRGSLINGPGRDKRVSLQFDVMNGEDVVGAVRLDKVKVEEEDEEDFKGWAEIPVSAIRSDPPTRLRITMAVKDT